MAPADFFCFILFSHLVIILSAENGNGHQVNCPTSFNCGNVGTFHYPFTKAEQPECGLILMHDCDNNVQSPKTIQLEKNGTRIVHTGAAQQNSISVFDEKFHNFLQSGNCDSWNNNYTLPSPSPLVSFYIKFNVTLFRCKHDLDINPPSHYFKHECHDYDIFYYHGICYTNNTEEARRLFSSCSVLQYPSKDVTDSDDILSFVSAQIVLQVVLSNDCDHCYNHRRGQCRLDSKQNFYCHHNNESMSKKKHLWLLLGLGIGFSALLGILIIGCLLSRKQTASSSDLQQHQSRTTCTDAIDPFPVPEPESGIVYFGILLFSYQELKEATNNFHPNNQLGIGGFGAVYYGKLRDGREVAVKRLYEHNYRRMQQFTNEIKILTCMRHTNLVSLYGCTSPLCHELLLVYEYVPNGTVACHLHGDLSSNGSTLPWHIRMTIAKETASALVYLLASDIIHRDVKTQNILLTDTFSVKVADFGLSRLFPSDVTHASTAPQGTPGYVDPEYHQCYKLTTKSDVYSFGVVLMELISSMPAVDMKRHKGDINLANLALKKIHERALSELVDPCLGFDSDSEVQRMISSVAELAFQCLQRDKDLRPSMDEVLKVLMIIECGMENPEEDLRSPLCIRQIGMGWNY